MYHYQLPSWGPAKTSNTKYTPLHVAGAAKIALALNFYCLLIS